MWKRKVDTLTLATGALVYEPATGDRMLALPREICLSGKGKMEDYQIELHEFDTIPRWACVAFAARCARRSLPVIAYGGLQGGVEVQRVLEAVEAACRSATEIDEKDVFKLVDEIDDIEVSYRGRLQDEKLGASEIARLEDARRVACKAISAAKLAAFCTIRFSERFAKNAWDAYCSAASAGCCGSDDDPDEAITNSEIMYEWMRTDFNAIVKAAVENGWNDESPVPPEFWPPMWPTTSTTWALQQSDWGEIR